MNNRPNLNDPNSFLADDWYEQYLLIIASLNNPVFEKIPKAESVETVTKDLQQQIAYEIFGSPDSTSISTTVTKTTASSEDSSSSTSSPYPLQNMSTDDFVDEETLEHIPSELVEKSERFYFYHERWVVRVRTIIDRNYQFIGGKFLTFEEKEKLTYCKETKKLYLDQNEVVFKRKFIPKKVTSIADKELKFFCDNNSLLTFKRKRVDSMPSNPHSGYLPQKSP